MLTASLLAFPLSAIVLGALNIFLTVAIFILVGVIIVWFCSAILKTEVPGDVRYWYLVVVGLYALYMFIALLFGLPVPSLGIVH